MDDRGGPARGDPSWSPGPPRAVLDRPPRRELGWADVRTGAAGRRRRLQGALTAAMVVLGLVTAVLLAHPPARAPDADSPAREPAVLGAVALDPVGHRALGCLALAPAGEPRGTVVLDAGHGAPDPGASGRTREGRLVDEADLVLAVTRAAAERLRADGVRVVLTRAGEDLGARLAPDRFVDGVLTTAGLRAQLAARARCANLARADALVSVHLNAAEDPDVRGSETLYDPNRPFSARNRELASSLHRSILDGYARAGRPAIDHGLGAGGTGSARGDLVLLAPASERVTEPSLVPGTLIEPLFLTHPDEASFVASAAGRAVLAAAIADGVERYLDATRP